MKQTSTPHLSTPLVYKVRDYPAQKTGRTSKTILFFCPFGIPSRQLALPGLPIWRLRRAGYDVVAYSYPLAIATVSTELTIDNMEAIMADAENRIQATPDTAEIICFGASMGTVLATNIASCHDRIKKLILNLSYAEISENILALPDMRTIPQKRLQQYIAKGGDADDLRRAFAPYSPIALVDTLRHKQVLLYLSQHDKILKMVHTAKFREALQAHDVQLEYYENAHGGHYYGVLTNYLRFRRYLQFINS